MKARPFPIAARGGRGTSRRESDQLDALRKMTDDYRRVRQARAELVRWQRRLLTLVDALEAARVQLGKAEFQKGRSPASRKPRSSRK